MICRVGMARNRGASWSGTVLVVTSVPCQRSPAPGRHRPGFALCGRLREEIPDSLYRDKPNRSRPHGCKLSPLE
jgi:hypothetical protein